MSEKAATLEYESPIVQVGLDIVEYEAETQITFPSLPAEGRWKPFFRVLRWLGVTVLACVVLALMTSALVVVPLLALPIICLYLLATLIRAIFGRPPTRDFDLLAANARGVRLEHHRGTKVNDVEIDWEAIRSYQFRLASVQLRLGPVFGIETIGGDYMIELHKPIDRELEILQILDRYRAKWASKFTPEQLSAIEADQDRLVYQAGVEV